MMKARHKNGGLFKAIHENGCDNCIFINETAEFCEGFLKMDNITKFDCSDGLFIFIEKISEKKGLKKKLIFNN